MSPLDPSGRSSLNNFSLAGHPFPQPAGGAYGTPGLGGRNQPLASPGTMGSNNNGVATPSNALQNVAENMIVAHKRLDMGDFQFGDEY